MGWTAHAAKARRSTNLLFDPELDLELDPEIEAGLKCRRQPERWLALVQDQQTDWRRV